MSLHRKCVTCFILLCTLFFATESFDNGLANKINGGESGEDENLKEALLLVEILKNEYTRALRENMMLRQRMAEVTTEPPEEPTCAYTIQLSSARVTVPSSTTASRATTSRQPATTTRASTVQRNLGLMAHFNDLARRKALQNIQVNKNFRRRMPSNYLYTSDALQSLRREEEAVSEEPVASESPELGTETETVTAESDVSTNPPEPTVGTAADKTDAPKSENAVKNKDEPVLSQVADELTSEIKGDKKLPILKSTSGRTRRSTRNTRYLSAIKPTLKIHLSKSTRLAVPLSKNNAFCYYNPNNALCRTSV